MMHRVKIHIRFRSNALPALAVAWLIAAISGFMLVGCQAVPQARPAAVAAELLLFHRLAPATFAAPERVVATNELATTTVVTTNTILTSTTTLTTAGPVTTAEASSGDVTSESGLPESAAVADTAPVSLAVPALAWSVPVVPMGWEAVLVNDAPTTRWLVPEAAGGWAVNSASPGAPGNMIVVGQQALGAALFRPFALGEVAVDDEIVVTSADGQMYRYRVVEVSPPIPAIGATADDRAAADAYLMPGEDARLTVVTGWPGDVSTHRIFIVAEYVGPQ